MNTAKLVLKSKCDGVKNVAHFWIFWKKMEDDHNGRRPKWKTIKMKDNQNGRRLKWKMTKVEDDQIEDDG